MEMRCQFASIGSRLFATIVTISVLLVFSLQPCAARMVDKVDHKISDKTHSLQVGVDFGPGIPLEQLPHFTGGDSGNAIKGYFAGWGVVFLILMIGLAVGV